MHTTRLASVAPVQDDDAILRGIEAVVAGMKMASRDAGGDIYRLGLRNEDGRIYRQIDVPCMRTVIAITECLRGLGFAAEPGAIEPAAHGCQIVFSRQPEVLPFGFARRHRRVQWREPQRPAAVPRPARAPSAVRAN